MSSSGFASRCVASRRNSRPRGRQRTPDRLGRKDEGGRGRVKRSVEGAGRHRRSAGVGGGAKRTRWILGAKFGKTPATPVVARVHTVWGWLGVGCSHQEAVFEGLEARVAGPLRVGGRDAPDVGHVLQERGQVVHLDFA